MVRLYVRNRGKYSGDGGVVEIRGGNGQATEGLLEISAVEVFAMYGRRMGEQVAINIPEVKTHCVLMLNPVPDAESCASRRRFCTRRREDTPN